MPYSDINKRKLYEKEWRRKYAKRYRKISTAHSIAAYANPIRQKCSIKECNFLGERHHGDYNKPKEIVWLCKTHHEAIHHKLTCKICGAKHRARGYCQKHWQRWRRGAPLESNGN